MDGITVRNDTGVYEGGEISLFYDPMIAKLVTHGPDRLTAIDAMADALDNFRIDGIRHNIDFCGALMQHPRFRDGALTWPLLMKNIPTGLTAHRSTARALKNWPLSAHHVANDANARHGKPASAGRSSIYA